jgi:hypothetical protein
MSIKGIPLISRKSTIVRLDRNRIEKTTWKSISSHTFNYRVGWKRGRSDKLSTKANLRQLETDAPFGAKGSKLSKTLGETKSRKFRRSNAATTRENRQSSSKLGQSNISSIILLDDGSMTFLRSGVGLFRDPNSTFDFTLVGPSGSGLSNDTLNRSFHYWRCTSESVNNLMSNCRTGRGGSQVENFDSIN